jgi:MFS family permease
VSSLAKHTMQDRRWLVLWVTCIGAFMSPLDFSAVSVALPSMGRDVHLSFAAALWVQAGYLLTYTLMLVPSGRIADQLGRLGVWRAGIAVFAITSLLTGVSPDTAWLLVARSLQGIGAGIMTGTATALVSTVFPMGERGRAIGINVMAIYLGLSTGPLIGGLLVSSFGWRWVFFVNVPIAAATLIAARRLHDPDRRRGRPQLDLPGTGLLTVGLGCLLIPLTFGADWGWSSTRTVALFVISAVALVTFGIVEPRVASPVLDLGLFRRSRAFAAANAAALLNYTAMFGSIALTAIALQVVAGKSPIMTGFILILQPAVMVCLSSFGSNRIPLSVHGRDAPCCGGARTPGRRPERDAGGACAARARVYWCGHGNVQLAEYLIGDERSPERRARRRRRRTDDDAQPRAIDVDCRARRHYRRSPRCRGWQDAVRREGTGPCRCGVPRRISPGDGGGCRNCRHRRAGLADTWRASGADHSGGADRHGSCGPGFDRPVGRRAGGVLPLVADA